jgi:uncharacterized repeat protein (TIGR03803 family)
VRDIAGNFYGTTNQCGFSGVGTIWKVSNKGKETILHSFYAPSQACYPIAGVARDSKGNLYGMAAKSGCVVGYGSLYRWSAKGNTGCCTFLTGHAVLIPTARCCGLSMARCTALRTRAAPTATGQCGSTCHKQSVVGNGLKFKIKGRFHFGWARLTVTTTKNEFTETRLLFTATLTGYAYETIPGKGIVAGKAKGPDVITVDPASLGHLAAVASALPAWRVRQTAATTH